VFLASCPLPGPQLARSVLGTRDSGRRHPLYYSPSSSKVSSQHRSLTNTMSASCSMSEWAPRRELALPNELLHKIILWVLRDSIHSICTSTQDTTWDRNVMETLQEVSPSFKAISSEIAVKAFDISRDIKNDNEA